MQLVTRLLVRLMAVGTVMMAIALAATLLSARQNISDEVDSSERIGRLLSAMDGLRQELPVVQQVAAIDALNDEGQLRHFHIALFDTDGRRLTREPQEAGATSAITRWLLKDRPMVPYRLTLSSTDGQALTVELMPHPQAESAEAITGAFLQFGLFGAIALALIVALWISVRRALAPLSGILSGIARIEDGDYASPIARCHTRELDQIAQALNHLAAALTLEHAKQRELLHRLQEVQEDERRRLAHELHDEFGQLLTAMQVDASYLLKQSSGQPALQDCAKAMYDNSGTILAQLRGLLAQLRPYGLQGGEDQQIALEQALRDLVRQRQQRGDKELECRLSVALGDVQLPQRLAVAIYRIVQEALTNVMRHAQASRVEITLRADMAAGQLEVQVVDDGRGFAAQGGPVPGLGLTGIRERVLANQGILILERANPQGLALRASFPLSDDAEAVLRQSAHVPSHSAATPAPS
jgi:two-component system sensor histidine kinase UhpB